MCVCIFCLFRYIVPCPVVALFPPIEAEAVLVFIYAGS